jgi:hypothetical protein
MARDDIVPSGLANIWFVDVTIVLTIIKSYYEVYMIY